MKQTDHQNALQPAEQTFLKRSLQKYQRGVWLRWGVVAVIVLIAIIAGGLAYYANGQRTTALQLAQKAYEAKQDAVRQKQAAEQQSRIALIRSLVAYALQDNAQDERERAALLARHAYLLNQQYRGNVDKQIDDALRTIFRTNSIIEEPYSKNLVEQVCQKVKLRIALKPEEWVQLIGDELSDQAACPELQKIYPLRLRNTTMIATDAAALSLNLRNSGKDVAYPTQYVENQFETQEGVILDKATGLMWEQAGSTGVTYADAIAYCDTRTLAGYEDWRLPTVEELLSLLEPEEPVLFFGLTADAFDELKSGDDPLPDDVLERLQPMIDQKLDTAAGFVNAVQQAIGTDAATQYQTRLLELAKHRDDLYLDLRFSRDQYWVWSADIRTIKGEGSAESWWLVSFDSGYVSGKHLSYDVRCVRCGQ